MTEDQACTSFNDQECELPSSVLKKMGVILCGIKDRLTIIVSNTANIIAGEQRIATGSTISLSGDIPAGAQSLDIRFSEDFTGSICGVPYDGSKDYSKSFSAKWMDNLGAIPVVVTTGSIYVTRVD